MVKKMLKQYDTLVQEVLEDIFEITRSDDKKLNIIIKEYFLNGGKRVRVLLLLICSNLGDFEKNKKNIIRIASIVEIIHTASLIHDDIIDKAKTRRGQTTMSRAYGEEYALYVGDYLFATVLREIAEFKDERLHMYLSNTLKELCIGEIIQEEGLYNIRTRRIDYLKKIKRKTAILIAFATSAGSIVSCASNENIQRSYAFGYYLGMSYQIIDDYLDFAGGSEILGKEIGQDLINGNITLPAIIAREHNSALFKNFSKDSSLEEKQNIIKFIKNTGSILNETLEISQRYLEKALLNIENLGNDNVKEELVFVMDKLARRKN